jgi:hypothetical protein
LVGETVVEKLCVARSVDGHSETARFPHGLWSQSGRYDVLNLGIHTNIRNRPARQRE